MHPDPGDRSSYAWDPIFLFIWLIICTVYNKNNNHKCSGNTVVKNLPVNAGDVSSVPRMGRSPGEGNGNTLQYSRLGNPMEEPEGLQFMGSQRLGYD